MKKIVQALYAIAEQLYWSNEMKYYEHQKDGTDKTVDPDPPNPPPPPKK